MKHMGFVMVSILSGNRKKLKLVKNLPIGKIPPSASSRSSSISSSNDKDVEVSVLSTRILKMEKLVKKEGRKL